MHYYPYIGLDQIVGVRSQIVGVDPATGAPIVLQGPADNQRASIVPRGAYPFAAPAAAVMQPGMGGPQLAVRQPRDAREVSLGFPLTSIAANVTTQVQGRPQLPFRPSRLVIPSNIADFFLVVDIKIGVKSQMVGFDPLPAAQFTQTAVGTALSLDTCDIGQLISISAQNISASTQNFVASFTGTAID